MTPPSPRFLRHAALILMVAATATCRLTRPQVRAVEVWLICDECTPGERAAVESIGPKAVRLLDNVLRNGPSPARRQVVRDQLANSYSPTATPPLTRDEYTNLHLANYVAGYQKRAAIALADIGDDRARRALQEALADTLARGYRADVIGVIRRSVIATQVPRFSGTVQTPSVWFGDTVVLRAQPGPPFTGGELATMDRSPWPAAALRLLVSPDSLLFLAVADAGPHLVSVSIGRLFAPRQVAGITIRSILDRNDRRMISCPVGDVDCQQDSAEVMVAPAISDTFATFISLTRTLPRPDTVDFFRIRPPDRRRVTARLDWPTGTENLDLSWLPCRGDPVTFVPNTTGVTAANPETTSVVIDAGICAQLVVRLVASGPRPVFPRLRVTSSVP